MGTNPLAEIYEELKERRRQGASDVLEAHPLSSSKLSPEVFATLRDFIEQLPKLDAPRDSGSSDQYLIRLIDIATLAARVFGDEGKSKAWLKRPNSSLSGQRPVDLLKDELGAAVVREILEQIDHGIFA
jgi:hypothetical protein